MTCFDASRVAAFRLKCKTLVNL